MKYRKDFVTNSSSSSFICEVCGHETSGWDMGLSDAGMYECENGHVFCRNEAVSIESKELIQIIMSKGYNHVTWPKEKTYSETELDHMDYDELLNLAAEDGDYGIPDCMCPICSFQVCDDSVMVKYLLKRYQLREKDILKEWKRAFSNYKELLDYLK